MTAAAAIAELEKHADKLVAKRLQQFFKTGPGQYGQGDCFIGVKVPKTRSVAKKFPDLKLSQILILLKSKIHEQRLLALIIMRFQFKTGTKVEQRRIYDAYFKHMQFVNNWDLVDGSASYIVGAYLNDRSRKPLVNLAKSNILWERRIAIMSTFYFIREKDFNDTLKISQMLIKDTEDLIHKAVGWMLREIGKRNQVVEERFLRQYYLLMPRTMLRYAIEKFPENIRKRYLLEKYSF